MAHDDRDHGPTVLVVGADVGKGGLYLGEARMYGAGLPDNGLLITDLQLPKIEDAPADQGLDVLVDVHLMREAAARGTTVNQLAGIMPDTSASRALLEEMRRRPTTKAMLDRLRVLDALNDTMLRHAIHARMVNAFAAFVTGKGLEVPLSAEQREQLEAGAYEPARGMLEPAPILRTFHVERPRMTWGYVPPAKHTRRARRRARGRSVGSFMRLWGAR